VPKVKGFRDEMLHKDFAIFGSIFVQPANRKQIPLAPAQCERLRNFYIKKIAPCEKKQFFLFYLAVGLR
jgi:hypothetical protein